MQVNQFNNVSCPQNAKISQNKSTFENKNLDKDTLNSFKENNKLDADTFKGNNYKRGLKVLDEEILNCKRADFDSDEAYTNHKKMLLEERQGYVTKEADAKAKKSEVGTNGAAKILEATGNFLGNVATIAGKVIEIVGLVK